MSDKKTNTNLDLWNAVCTTPKSKTKAVSFGRKYTSVNPQYQIRCATEQFGHYGSTWGFKTIENETMKIGDEILLTIKAVFYYPNGEFPITNSTKLVSKNKIDTDAYKKLETDTLTKALSRLGFNADIFEGLYDDPNYVSQIEQDEELTAKSKGAYIKKPKLTTKQHKSIISRLKKGEGDLIAKASSQFEVSAAQMAEMEQEIEQYMKNAIDA